MLAASKFLLSSAANKKNIGCSGVQTEVLMSSGVLSELSPKVGDGLIF